MQLANLSQVIYLILIGNKKYTILNSNIRPIDFLLYFFKVQSIMITAVRLSFLLWNKILNLRKFEVVFQFNKMGREIADGMFPTTLLLLYCPL